MPVSQYKLKNGQIRHRVVIRRRDSPPHFKGGFTSKRLAEDYQSVKLSEMIRGTFVAKSTRDCGSLADGLERYATEVLPQESHAHIKRARINRWKKAAFANMTITKLTRTQFEDWTRARQQEKRQDGLRQISDKSIYKELVVVIGFWRYAKERWQWNLGDCPAAVGYLIKPRTKYAKVKKTRPRITPQLRQKITEIFSAGPGRNTLYAPMFNFAIETSIRAYELIQLRWEDIDWDARVISVSDRASKNGDVKHVALSDEALGILRKLDQNKSDERIFPVTRSALSSAWARAKQHEGFPKELTFHVTRHEALTNLAEMGLSVNQLMDQSGIKTVSILQVYLQKSKAQDILAKMANAGKSTANCT